MLNKETTTILNQFNNEEGIAHVIAESLIRYYSVNGFYGEDVDVNYLDYLSNIFSSKHFYFLDTEKLLSYKDPIFSTVMIAVRDDLSEKTEPEELYLSCKWQPEVLDAILTVLFNKKLILAIVSY